MRLFSAGYGFISTRKAQQQKGDTVERCARKYREHGVIGGERQRVGGAPARALGQRGVQQRGAGAQRVAAARAPAGRRQRELPTPPRRLRPSLLGIALCGGKGRPSAHLRRHGSTLLRLSDFKPGQLPNGCRNPKASRWERRCAARRRSGAGGRRARRASAARHSAGAAAAWRHARHTPAARASCSPSSHANTACSALAVPPQPHCHRPHSPIPEPSREAAVHRRFGRRRCRPLAADSRRERPRTRRGAGDITRGGRARNIVSKNICRREQRRKDFLFVNALLKI